MATFDRSLRVDEKRFLAQMEVLARRFSVVPLETLVEQLLNGSVRPRQACVTFDDGYADNYEHAFPLLQRFGMPATIFLTTRPIEDKRPFWWERLAWHLSRRAGGTLSLPPALGGFDAVLSSYEIIVGIYDACVHRLQMLDAETRDALLDFLGAGDPPHERSLTWDEAATMQRAGIAFGAHTHDHQSLTALSGAALRETIARSRDVIAQRLGKIPSLFSYPFGEVDFFVRHAVEALGFRGAVTTQGGTCFSTTPRYLLPRICVGNWETRKFTCAIEQASAPDHTLRDMGRKYRAFVRTHLPARVAGLGKRIAHSLRSDGNRGS